MLKAILFVLFALAASANPILSVTYSGSPCVTGIGGEGTSASGITGQATDTVTATADAYYNPPGIGTLPASSCTVTVSEDLISSGTGAGFLSFSLFGGAESDPEFYINGVFEGD